MSEDFEPVSHYRSMLTEAIQKVGKPPYWWRQRLEGIQVEARTGTLDRQRAIEQLAAIIQTLRWDAGLAFNDLPEHLLSCRPALDAYFTLGVDESFAVAEELKLPMTGLSRALRSSAVIVLR